MYLFPIRQRIGQVSHKKFPNNLATNSVHHIKENIRTRFGPKAAEMVFPITKAFSTVVEETYWMKLQEQSERAFEYLAKNPNYSVVEYTMDYNKKVSYTTKINCLVGNSDIKYK